MKALKNIRNIKAEHIMFDLSGKKALVTGASGGLGQAIARALHAQGAVVTLSGTRRDALDALSTDLGERVHVVSADLSDAASTEQLIPAAESAMEGLDILVNNAGLTRDNLFIRMKDDEWDKVIAVNLTAAFRLTRAAVKNMMRRRFGRIITVTSVVGIAGNPGQANYAASKAGLIGMSKSLAAEVASRGITVNCIAPGFIESPMTDVLNDKQKESILNDVPMGCLGKGDDIAAAAVYLASNEAGYVTGATLHVNGGMTMI
jgi:3-oxoacyl-[acyl-carrier protein] reductase